MLYLGHRGKKSTEPFTFQGFPDTLRAARGGGRSCPILYQEQIIISQQARRQSKDLKKMHLEHTLKKIFSGSQVRSWSGQMSKLQDLTPRLLLTPAHMKKLCENRILCVLNIDKDSGPVNLQLKVKYRSRSVTKGHDD